MISKEEIEKAIDDFNFFYEGDYITREMSRSKDIVKEYIEELEKRLCNHNGIISRLEEDNTNWRGKYLIELAKVSDLEKRYRELDEMTAVKYSSIQRDAYFRGRAEEQQRAEQIIYENYIPKSKIKEKIEELVKEGYWEYLEQRDLDKTKKILQELLEEE